MWISIPTVRLRIPYLFSSISFRPFFVDIIQTHQLASTDDSPVDADSVAQSYHTMKQLSGESTNKCRIRMEDNVKGLQRLVLDEPFQQQEAMRFFPLDPDKHADTMAD